MPETTATVHLVRHTAETEELLASAAKLCYAADTETILEQERGRAAGFVEKLIAMGHMSPVEHAVFTFYVEGVSRAMTHQLVRHRVASYSQRSQRYVKHEAFDYVLPPQFAGQMVQTPGGPVPAPQYFAETMAIIAERYRALNRALGACGESANEDARYVLPNACETKIFVTMNARELIHFFEERLCQRAQWEIRGVAEKMLARAREVCPAVFNAVGPKCLRQGGCPEGTMTCGRYPEMRARFGPESPTRP